MTAKKAKTEHSQQVNQAQELQAKPRFSFEDKVAFALLALILLLAAMIRANFFQIPFERDEGIYGYIGKQILLGKTPYVDFYEQKFPGIFYFYGLMVYLFGDTVEGLHKGFMYLNLLTIVLIFLTSRKLFGAFPAVASAATFAFVSLTPNLSGFTVQSEHGVAFLSSVGLYIFAHYYRKQKNLYAFLMGLAFGLAFMTKTSGVFMVLFGGLAIVALLWLSEQRNFKKIILSGLIYSGGVVLVVAIFFFVIFLEGSFDEMIYWAYYIPSNYVGKIAFSDGMQYFKYTRDAILQNYKFFWYHSLLALPLCFFKTVPWKLKISAFLLSVLSFLTIVPGFYFYGHYWIQTLPGLAILAGLTWYIAERLITTKFRIDAGKFRLGYLLLFAILTFNHVMKQKFYYFHPNYDMVLRQVYGNNPFPESMEIAKYITANSNSEDQIALIGSEPQIFFYTKKQSPSRHAYFASVVNNVPQHKEWQREFVRDVEVAEPKFIVFFNHGISLFVQPDTDKYVFEWANKYITENYKMVGVVDMVEGQLQSIYTWGDQAQTYQPRGQNTIMIFERTIKS